VRHVAVNATFTGGDPATPERAHRDRRRRSARLVVPVVRTPPDSAGDRQHPHRPRTRARDSKLTLQDMEGGTFTISNPLDAKRRGFASTRTRRRSRSAVGAVKDEPVVRERRGRRPDPPDDADWPHRAIDMGRLRSSCDTRRSRAARPALVPTSPPTRPRSSSTGRPLETSIPPRHAPPRLLLEGARAGHGAGPVALYVKAWGGARHGRSRWTRVSGQGCVVPPVRLEKAGVRLR
jgi:hypothetical protein